MKKPTRPLNLSALQVQAQDYLKGERQLLLSPELVLKMIARINELEEITQDLENSHQK